MPFTTIIYCIYFSDAVCIRRVISAKSPVGCKHHKDGCHSRDQLSAYEYTRFNNDEKDDCQTGIPEEGSQTWRINTSKYLAEWIVRSSLKCICVYDLNYNKVIALNFIIAHAGLLHGQIC